MTSYLETFYGHLATFYWSHCFQVDFCLCAVLVSGVIVLLAAILLAIGFSFLTFLSHLYTIDPTKLDVGPMPLFPISSVHDRIFIRTQQHQYVPPGV